MKKLHRNLLLLFGAAALIVIALALATGVNIGAERLNRDEARASAARLQAIESLTKALYGAESSQRAYAASGAGPFLEDYHLQREVVDTSLRNFSDIQFADETEAALAQRLTQLVPQRISLMEELITIRRDEGAEAAANLIGNGSGKKLMDAIAATARELSRSESTRFAARELSAETQARRLLYLLAGGVLLNLMLLGGAFAVVHRELRRNARLLKYLRQNTHEISTINQLTSSLQSCQSREETAEVLHHFLALLFPAARGGLYLMHASRNLLSLAVTWGDDSATFMEPIRPQDCWALRLGRPHTRDAAANDIPCTHLEDPNTTSLCIPLMAQSDIVAMLHIRVDNAGQMPATQRLAELLATHAASALASIVLREALHQQSIRDPLTSLFNRRYLEESIERELLRTRRSNSPFSVIMLDIDHFKRLNDEFGHQAGDLLLKEFATYMRRNVRGEDIACRYGGEEFLLLLPGTDVEHARQRAEAIRQGMSSLELDFQGRRLPTVTASFGIAAFPLHGDDWETVVSLADSALYRAKADGRDRVVLADTAAAETKRVIRR